MIVAGSVLALLLMGLAVDGFVNPADEAPDDASDDSGIAEDSSDHSGEDGDGLLTLLEAGTEDPAQPQAYTPLSEIEPDAEIQGETSAEAEEIAADSAWIESEAAANATFMEVHSVAEFESGEDMAYVEEFNTDTDTLVLEFDGTDADAPEIEVEYNTGEDATYVLANGMPVALVEGAEEMTPAHVRIVMGGAEGPLTPQVLPAPETVEAETSGLEFGPQTLPPAPEPEQFGPQTLPPAPEPEQLGPQTLPTAPDPEMPVTEPAQPLVVDPMAPQVQVPIVDLALDAIDDGIPDDTVLNAILDEVTGAQITPGGTDEMLDARGGIDDAFGTGGSDALTGSYNDDHIEGSDGQDALFGDEGNDTLEGGAGNDELHGDTGNDDLRGGGGIDFLDGGDGDDSLDGGGDRDLLFGGDGDDVLYGGAANDFLQGGMGADMLNGGSGDDTLDGVFGDGTTDQDGADTLWGGDGDDTLILGAGDTAYGGAGADTFVSGSYVENAEIAGHVADFDPTEDRIEVIFDPQVSPMPTLEVQDFSDGSGADIILNGEVILSVAGAQGLDPNMIDLRAIA